MHLGVLTPGFGALAILFGSLLCLPLSVSAQDIWGGKAPYIAKPRPDDGKHMALTMKKIQQGDQLGRPLVIWALGSSYTNFLGDGSELIDMIRQRFPNAPDIVYHKHVGSATEYRFLDGWVRHLLIADPPDVVLLYAVEKGKGTPEEVIREIRACSTADILVPSIHYRKQRDYLWGKRDEPVDQNVEGIKKLVEPYGIEYVENRGEMAAWMSDNNLSPKDMTFDSVHQNKRTRNIINQNIARHFHVPNQFAYDPSERERNLSVIDGKDIQLGQGFLKTNNGQAVTASNQGATLEVAFKGNRIDMNARSGQDAGTAQLFLDGQPADEIDAYYATFIRPESDKGTPRLTGDMAPHGIFLEKNIEPQTWTITMVGEDGSGGFKLVGSKTGPDGHGNAQQAFTSDSGQIRLDPLDWRDPQKTVAGHRFVFEVKRATLGEVSFAQNNTGSHRFRLVTNLTNGSHKLKLVANGDGPITIESFDIYEPPLKQARE
ncbi:SGNH/GDSL hydrolase family protein [Bremerella alba]|uniref:Uncharacterized protein n=1 Tax=Bremerella alba TaxID=980252 RepID=A0A7V8V1U4_9BACT|nr:SGNH/GDSL hydrolase family protein [Bremerella alba]MBA2113261.1 hypothetical protein [Bremerella alba]